MAIFAMAATVAIVATAVMMAVTAVLAAVAAATVVPLAAQRLLLLHGRTGAAGSLPGVGRSSPLHRWRRQGIPCRLPHLPIRLCRRCRQCN